MSNKKRKKKLVKKIARSMREFCSLEPTLTDWVMLANKVECTLYPPKDSSEEKR